MARAKTKDLRVGKIEVIKSVARRPKGLFRPDQTHKDAKTYDRRRAKCQFKRTVKEES
jgi:hypothetical protein